MNKLSLPLMRVVVIGLAQGLCLLILYLRTEAHSWPSKSPSWAYPLWTLAIVVPLLLMLSIDRRNGRSVAMHVIAFGSLLALLAAYTGWQAEPYNSFPTASLTAAFVISIGIASFKALMYLQQRANELPLTYEVLFTYSWRNFLVGVLAGLFALMFSLILLLWGQLFKAIDIEIFLELFVKPWFSIPALSMAFALGIALFRELTGVIDTIATLLHWLTKLLLPMLLTVAVLFVAALPLAGLDLLWGTGAGTALLLWLLALTLFFTNAVYQDGREANPYPLLLHRAIYIALCALPIIAVLAFYGLVLRLQQYGWTVERCWAFVVWLILSLFAFGYAFGVIRNRDEWTAGLARVNTAMGLVVLAILLLANSPLLDFRKISVSSQLNRVESGDIELAEFDFWYVRNHLARPGYLAVQELRAGVDDDDSGLLDAIDHPRRVGVAVPLRNEDFWAKAVYRPESFEVPDELRSVIQRHARVYEKQAPVLIRTDLNDDGTNEYALVVISDRGITNSQIYYQDTDGWQVGYLSYLRTGGASEDRDALVTGEIKLSDPSYKNLEVGGVVLRPLIVE